MTHFEHMSHIVTLDGLEFFADVADTCAVEDLAGSTLCGLALAHGMLLGEKEEREHWQRRLMKGAPDDYELSGWNSGCAGLDGGGI